MVFLSLPLVTASLARYDILQLLEEDRFLASATIFNIPIVFQDRISTCYLDGIETFMNNYHNSQGRDLAVPLSLWPCSI